VPSHSPVPLLQRQRSRPGRSLVRSVRIFLFAMLLGLIPLFAAASPTDPTWICGIYDAADGDEIITLIGDQASSNGVAVYVIGRPIDLRQALLQREPCTAQGFFERRLNRGPPSGPAPTSPLPHLSPLVHFVSVGPHQPAAALREPTPRERTTPSAAVIHYRWCVTLKHQNAPAAAIGGFVHGGSEANARRRTRRVANVGA